MDNLEIDKLEKLLNWCREHDWGQGAYICHVYGDDEPWIAGLRDEALLAAGGPLATEHVALPADFRTIRQWAGY